MAVEFVAMAQETKAVAIGDLLLAVFDRLALKLFDLPTLDADEVIVVFVIGFVAGHSVFEMVFMRDPCVA